MNPNDTQHSVTEAAAILGVNREAVCAAIKYKKLKAYRIGNIWVVNRSDLNDYSSKRYDRSRSLKDNGERIWDPSKGQYTPRQLAALCNVSDQRVYHLLRTNQIPATRYRSAYIIQTDDLDALKKFVQAVGN